MKKIVLAIGFLVAAASLEASQVVYAWGYWKPGSSTWIKDGSYISPSHANLYLENPSATFTAVVTNKGWKVDAWYLSRTMYPESAGDKISGSDGKSELTWTDDKQSDIVCLSVKYAYISYAVKYAGEGTGIPSGTTTVGYKKEFNLAASPSRTGYTFTGWKDRMETVFEAGQVVKGASFPELESVHDDTHKVTLTAQWKANAYAIRFNGNGATDGSMSDLACTYDKDRNLTKNKFTKDCHDFVGWTTQEDGSGTLYGDGASVKNLSAEPDAVVTLYAKWQVRKHQVTVSAAPVGWGSVNPSGTASYEEGRQLQITASPFEGYVFKQWDDGSTQPSRTVSVLGAATYCATFAKKNYQIHFDANGGSGTMADVVATCHEDCQLPANDFVNGSFPFTSWNTRADGHGVTYWDRDSVNLSDSDGLTLYAQWDETGYVLKVYPCGGVYDGETAPVEYREFFPLVPQATNFNLIGISTSTNGAPFRGYYSGRDGSGTMVYDQTGKWVGGNGCWTADGKYARTGDMSVYAFWGPPPASLEVAFAVEPSDAGNIVVDYGGRQTTSNDFTLTVLEGSNFVMTAAVTNRGYSFSCWTNSLGFTTNDNPWTYAAPSVVTNVALFTGNVYKVTFDGQRGFKDTQTKYVTFGDVYGEPETPVTMVGYKLEGWYTEQEGGGKRYDAADRVEISQDHRLYANWAELEKYTIHYVGNGATSGSMEDQMPYCETPTALTANAFVKKGYTFANWTNDVGDVFADGATVTDLAGAEESVTLYAVWSNNVYWVDYDANGGEGTMSSQRFTYDVTTNLAPCAYVKAGLEFAGWTNEVKNLFFTNGAEVTNLCTGAAGDDLVTLTAVWAQPDLGELSRAMHCSTLKWELANDQGGFPWQSAVGEEAGYRGSGSEVKGLVQTAQTTGQSDHLIAAVTTAGTLRFAYKLAKKQGGVAPTLTLCYKTAEGWTDVKSWEYDSDWDDFYRDPVEVTVTDEMVAEGAIGFVVRGGNTNYACLDQVSWTSASPVPQQGDPVAIESASASGGAFRLGVAGEAGVNYGVWTNADLAVPAENWGFMTNWFGEGTPFEFKLEIRPDERQLFYRAYKVK